MHPGRPHFSIPAVYREQGFLQDVFEDTASRLDEFDRHGWCFGGKH
jgi:hypothetical protein